MDRTCCVLMLCVFGAMLAGCNESAAVKREGVFCANNPDMCDHGKLVAGKSTKPGPSIDPSRLALPDLFVRNVGCDAISTGPNGGVMMGAHIKNQGHYTTGVPFDIAASTSVGSDPTLLPVTQSQGPLAENVDHFYPIAPIPGADPANLPPTKFEVYVNPPRPASPGGLILESDITNNRNCGVCRCDSQTGCTVTQDPTCNAGP